MTGKKAEVYIATFDKYQLGHDLRIFAENTTVEDVLDALAAFAQQHLADCRGCDGCCHERVPLTAPDAAALAELLPETQQTVADICRAFTDINIDKNAIVDITLKRDEDGACIFLHKEGKYCQNWQARPFVCRSHFCLPKSERLIALRYVIANSGENELIRRILAEQVGGGELLLPPEIDMADYPQDAVFSANSWRDIRIKDIVPEDLWEKLREE